MNLKKCSKCNKSKDLNCYSAQKLGKNGKRASCKECIRLTANPLLTDKLLLSRVCLYCDKNLNSKTPYKIYCNKICRRRKNHIDNLDKKNLARRVYRKENKVKDSKIRRKRYKEDINYRLKCVLRARLRAALKNNQKQGSAVADLGCSIPELKQHLEAKFKPGMTWENRGKYSWHIDHIKPLASFDLSSKEEFLKACHYTNLQPLWAKDNMKKGAKYKL